jgi:hypothetical protein
VEGFLRQRNIARLFQFHYVSKTVYLFVSGTTDFDDWSIDLCILSLCKSNHFSLQTIAISLLIELFGYTLSSSNSNEKLSIIPLFPQKQVLLLVNETHFFQHIIADLWEYLSDRYDREYNLKSSHLLSMLHSMLPNNLCEDLICNQIFIQNITQDENDVKILEGYKRFFKLWNSTRDVSFLTNEYLTKSFQHCLLCVLNILQKSNNFCLKSIVEQWICDCFVHGEKNDKDFCFCQKYFFRRYVSNM